MCVGVFKMTQAVVVLTMTSDERAGESAVNEGLGAAVLCLMISFMCLCVCVCECAHMLFGPEAI